jgi:hypothetical protein
MSSVMLIALGMLLSWPARTYACACCADWGERMEIKDKLDESVLQYINSLRFSGIANLYVTDASSDTLYGIASPADGLNEKYRATLTCEPHRWTLVFKDEKGGRGTLVLSMPNTATFFAIDPRDGRPGGGGGPLLYKETRLEGRVRGNGIFKQGMTAGTKFHLVLQGRGNRCPAVEDFKHWNLRVSGPKASYTFYGAFARPAAQKSN